MSQNDNNETNWSSSIMNVSNMTPSNTKFIIIQDKLNRPNSQDRKVPPTIYEWFNTTTPSKALFEFANNFLFKDPDKTDYELQLAKENGDKNAVIFIENSDVPISEISGKHIIELIAVPKPKK